jgi:hypothetical protein
MSDFNPAQQKATKKLRNLKTANELQNQMHIAASKALRKFFKLHNIPLNPAESSHITAELFPPFKDWMGDKFALKK